MNAAPQFRRFRRAVQQHLRPVEGLTGCHAFLRGRSGDWVEGARLGTVKVEAVEPLLMAFDGEAGGSVEPLDGGGWMATYALAAPGVDVMLLFFLGGIAASDLSAKLSLLETKVGWLAIAGLADLEAAREDVGIGAMVGAEVLLEAARARNRRELADQWIARLEKTFTPELIAVSWLKGTRARVGAISGGNLIERNSRTRAVIEAFAGSAVEARTPLIVDLTAAAAGEGGEPPQDASDERPEAQVMALDAQRGLAIPVYEGDQCRGVVTAFWGADSLGAPPGPDGADLIGQVLGEALVIQARARPSILRRLGNWLGGLARAIFGPRALKLKLFALAAAIGIAVLAVLPSNYQPSFAARIEAQDRQVVSAPFDGFLVEAPFQLGDRVEAGELLVAMEESDFRLQYARAQAEARRLDAELQTARAQRDTAELRTLDAQQQQVAVQLDLLEQQLELARREADAARIVVGGDAWRRVGGRVRLGEPLLELASPDSFRVLAFIDEDWVADIPAGTSGAILLAAYPDRPVPVTLDTITTDTQPRDGVNTFAAWLEVGSAGDVTVLDGMRGVVRLEVEQTTMLRAYTRGPLRWLERRIWRWQ